MRFFTVAIVAAFLCVATVSAKLQSAAGEQLLKDLERLDCAGQVIKKSVAGDFDDEVSNYVDKLELAIFYTRKFCGPDPNPKEDLKCKKEIAQELTRDYQSTLFAIKEKNEKLQKEIIAKIEAQC